MDDHSAAPEPFDAADAAFRLLCAGPQPLALHAAKVAAGLPDRPVPLDELRVLLLHPSTSARARNQVWAELVRRARAGDPAWTVGLAGIAMPGLRRAVGSLAAAWRGDPADLQAEVLTGFLAAVRALDPDDLESVPLASRLCWAAWRAGQEHASRTWPSWRSSAACTRGPKRRVIDPEDEYARLAGAVGGAYIHLGAPGVHLNPFDLPAAGRARPDTLYPPRPVLRHRRRGAVRRRAVPGRAGGAGQGDHDRLPAGRDHLRPPDVGAARPLLPALATALRAAKTPAATALADRLVPFTEGSHAACSPPRPPPAPTGTWSSSASATSPTSCARRRPCSPWIPPGGRSPTPPGAGGG